MQCRPRLSRRQDRIRAAGVALAVRLKRGLGGRIPWLSQFVKADLWVAELRTLSRKGNSRGWRFHRDELHLRR